MSLLPETWQHFFFREQLAVFVYNGWEMMVNLRCPLQTLCLQVSQWTCMQEPFPELHLGLVSNSAMCLHGVEIYESVPSVIEWFRLLETVFVPLKLLYLVLISLVSFRVSVLMYSKTSYSSLPPYSRMLLFWNIALNSKKQHGLCIAEHVDFNRYVVCG